MNSTFKKMTMSVALMAVATGIAAAQTYRAEIPFAFQVGGKVMAPGNYALRISSQHAIVTLANVDAKDTAMIMANNRERTGKETAGAPPALTFECGVGRCALSRLRTGVSDTLMFARPKGGTETAAATEIRLVKLNGD